MASSQQEAVRNRAVVLLSGGMDSAVCAALAVRDYKAAALHVSYGQRTEARERIAFTRICDRLGIGKRLVVRNEALGLIGGSALTDQNLEVPQAGRPAVAAGRTQRSNRQRVAPFGSSPATPKAVWNTKR